MFFFGYYFLRKSPKSGIAMVAGIKDLRLCPEFLILKNVTFKNGFWYFLHGILSQFEIIKNSLKFYIPKSYNGIIIPLTEISPSYIPTILETPFRQSLSSKRFPWFVSQVSIGGMHNFRTRNHDRFYCIIPCKYKSILL